MNTNSIKAEFLNVCPVAFRQLHAVFGFDFCAEYHMAKVEGKYTINSLLKTAKANGCDLENDILIAATKADRRFLYHSYTIFQIVAPGKIEIEFEERLPFVLDGGVDTFCTKNSVDEVRKDKTANTVLIWQNKESLRKPEKKEIDLNQRFRVTHLDYCNYNGSRCINRLFLKGKNSKGEEFDVGLRADRVDDPSAAIDKSGYLLVHRRNEWKRKAETLRASRAKAAYNAVGTTEKVNSLYSELMAYKSELATALMTAATYDEIKKIDKLVGDYRGLSDLMYDYELFKKRSEEKAYASIERSDEVYNRIKDGLNQLRTKQQEAA